MSYIETSWATTSLWLAPPALQELITLRSAKLHVYSNLKCHTLLARNFVPTTKFLRLLKMKSMIWFIVTTHHLIILTKLKVKGDLHKISSGWYAIFKFKSQLVLFKNSLFKYYIFKNDLNPSGFIRVSIHSQKLWISTFLSSSLPQRSPGQTQLKTQIIRCLLLFSKTKNLIINICFPKLLRGEFAILALGLIALSD